MRRLWITRRKAMAASAMKMKVYIEAPENGDTDINGCLCRKLGELKNDQQKHFNIGHEEAKVFVIADKLSRNLYNEFIRIPEGEDDVFLSGRNYLKPSAGNPFRFDGVEEEEVLENRENGRRRGRVLLIAAVIVGILVGVLAGIAVSKRMLKQIPQEAAVQAFDCGELRITLTEEFAETAAEGYTACYSSGETAVLLMREDFSAKEGFGALSLEDYGALVLTANHLEEDVTLESEGSLTVFDWVITDEETGVPYYYYCGLYKGENAFWMVQITTLAEDVSAKLPQFRQWLESVQLNG